MRLQNAHTDSMTGTSTRTPTTVASAALGTALAFMMSVIGLSLPEMIILRKVLRVRLIAVFAGVVGSGILAVGYLFNVLM